MEVEGASGPGVQSHPHLTGHYTEGPKWAELSAGWCGERGTIGNQRPDFCL